MNPVPAVIPKVTYMTLHVTLIATKAPINPELFNIDHTVPAAILTTLPNNLTDAPFFNSISRVKLLHSGESVWKIFSPKRISEETLKELFGKYAKIPWIHRKVWQAYPRLDPISEFAPIELYPQDASAGVWYTSGIESFISTMETSALSGRNVAHLIARRLWDTKGIV
jgi:prenylcysteine oxidase / farnesylcysteine lyase